jgi:hypothetical protein
MSKKAGKLDIVDNVLVKVGAHVGHPVSSQG